MKSKRSLLMQLEFKEQTTKAKSVPQKKNSKPVVRVPSKPHAEPGMQPPTPFPWGNAHFPNGTKEFPGQNILLVVDYSVDTDFHISYKGQVYDIVSVLKEVPTKGDFPTNYYPDGRPTTHWCEIRLSMEYDQTMVIKLN